MSEFPKPPAGSIRPEIERPDAELVRQAGAFGTATIHEAAGQIGALPSAIKPIAPGMRLCGPAVTVQGPPRDNLWIHRAIHLAAPGDVLVVNVSGFFEAGYFGEIMAHACQARGIVGLVIDGCVRDGEIMAGMGFPVFARGLCIRGTGKDHHARGFVNAPIVVGDVVVQPGDLIAGDGDGVVAVPREKLADAVEGSRTREQREAKTIEALKGGRTTIELYGWSV